MDLIWYLIIQEEVGYADEEDDFLDEAFFLSADLSSRNRERHITSPDRLQRIERSRRQRSRSGSGSSQTSSDTSDTDEVGGVAVNAAIPARLPFSRHRHRHHHHDRHRSQSSCSSRMYHSGGTYSRESSENESPTRGSAPVLFFPSSGDEQRDGGLAVDVVGGGVKRRIPVLQHSQSLMSIIPGSVKGDSGSKVHDGGDGRASKKKHLLHRPHR